VTGGEKITPVILCGGAGRRLWPYSRPDRPKPFLPLAGLASTLDDTLDRVSGQVLFTPPLIVTHHSLLDLVETKLRAHGIPAHIVLEPVGRDSAAAIAVAAEIVAREQSSPLMLVLAADHLIRDRAGFVETVLAGIKAARTGHVVTFGVPPDHPSSAFGYIRPGKALDGTAHAISLFHEKPSTEQARALITDGCLWNSGNFLFKADVLLEELNNLEPHIAAAAGNSVASMTRFVRGQTTVSTLQETEFAAAPAKSIDFAVMERTNKAAVVRARHDWSDIGTWRALWAASARDGDGNVTTGPAQVVGGRNMFVLSEGPQTYVCGVENLTVIVTPDAVLIAPLAPNPEVAAEISKLAVDGQTRVQAQRNDSAHTWGTETVLQAGPERGLVLTKVNPGQSFSKTAAHKVTLIVTQGLLHITHGGDVAVLATGGTLGLPAGSTYLVSNSQPVSAEFLEVPHSSA
jgi:mannose-1-phosphate guanylyltransferase / mannose-6-phosphate isomerase